MFLWAINALQNYLSGGQLEAGTFTILIITNEYKFHRIKFQILINTMGFFLQIKGAYMYVSRFCIICRKQPIAISTIKFSILLFVRWIRKSMSDGILLFRPFWPQNCLRILYNCFLNIMVQLREENNIHRPQRRGDIIHYEIIIFISKK